MSSEWTPQKDGKVSLASHRLEALRGYLGKISQQQLANRTGLSRRTIQDWENQGKTTVKTYTAFLNQLGVTDLRQFDKHYEDFHRPFSEIVRKGLPLVLPSTEWEPDWMPPGALLRAESGIVRFHQRQRELAELTEWCCSSSGLQVQLCHAPGGMGKTRLAIELCRQMREKEKWQAGILDTAAFREDEELWQGVLTSGGRLLLVLDYAESCSGILHWVFSQVTAIHGAHVRILLLTRKVGDWLEQLKSASPARELLTGPAFSQRRLGAVTVEPGERLNSWQMAHEDLAKALGIPAASLASTKISLAYRLSEAGQDARAAEELQRAVRILEDLYVREPAVARARLAQAQNNYAGVLNELSRRTEALAASRRATTLYEAAELNAPGTYQAEWAASLNSLATM
ncbi:MAG: helix-turn-helix domain-containing protein, partial [Planctomyces sp.]